MREKKLFWIISQFTYLAKLKKKLRLPPQKMWLSAKETLLPLQTFKYLVSIMNWEWKVNSFLITYFEQERCYHDWMIGKNLHICYLYILQLWRLAKTCIYVTYIYYNCDGWQKLAYVLPSYQRCVEMNSLSDGFKVTQISRCVKMNSLSDGFKVTQTNQSILFHFCAQMKESHISWKWLMVNGTTNLVEFLSEVDMVLALYLCCLLTPW